jgi:hypothetical protein
LEDLLRNAMLTTTILLVCVTLAGGGCDRGAEGPGREPNAIDPSAEMDSTVPSRDARTPERAAEPEPPAPAMSVPPAQEKVDVPAPVPEPAQLAPSPSKIQDRCGRPLVT